MSGLAEFAAALRACADRCESSLALEAASEGVDKYLTVLRAVTPKRSGALAASEVVNSLSGGGTHAVATAGPHKIYAVFRNDGGSIDAAARWIYHGNRRYRHTLFFDGTFALHVTQAGSHYMERSEGPGRGAVASACAEVAARMVSL